MNRILILHLPTLFLLSLASSQVVHAVLVFDNGGPNTVDTLVTDFIEVYDSLGGDVTTVTFDTGAIITGTHPSDDTVAAFDRSVVNILDGIFSNDVTGYDESTINVYGGSLIDDLFGLQSATINVFGGTVVEDVTVLDDATAYLTGGVFNEDIEVDGGLIDISGGMLAANGLGGLDIGLGADADGTIILRGSSFTVNGVPATSGPIADISGTISGTLADGSTFTDVPFDRDPSGGPDTGNIIIAIPEPSPFVAWCLCGLLFTGIKRRNSRCLAAI
ncbi:MAG: hypothetical protein AAF497_02085 [Planctomycetota bacterium]